MEEERMQRHRKYRVFLYHHTHWDREWWQTVQDFRIRLVELIDELLDTLDSDPEFKCFLLDGQTIVLKDYLEIRPEHQERLIGYIRAGRIQCGPWYILPDEFLVSGEAHIRNLWLGRRMAAKLQYDNLDVGYIPDTFGHISQMPQLLRGFGIDNAMVWRGLGGPSPDFKQEFLWEAPDGSQVFTYWFPDGYYVIDFIHFDNPLKTYDDKQGRVRRSLERWAERATTDVLLMPYGGDHRLIDKNLPRLLKLANEDLKEHAEILWGSTKDFIEAVRSQNPKLAVLRGELRDVGAEHPHLLPGVLSSRMYLKQLNFQGQNALERYAEPFSALAWLHGKRYETSLLWTAWEQLVQNHPHDSICGCSIDQVHREMLPRFAQSKQIADNLTERSVQHINGQINTSDLKDGEHALVVHNPLSWTRAEPAVVWMDRTLAGGIHPRTHMLLDSEGREVPFQLKEVGGVKPMTDKYWYTELKFSVMEVPGMGYKTFVLKKRDVPLDSKELFFTAEQSSAKLKGSGLVTDLQIGSNSLQNSLLRVEIDPVNGTLNVVDRKTGKSYSGLGAFEDGGDSGDTYNYSAPLLDQVKRTTDPGAVKVHVSVMEAGYTHAVLRVDLDWMLPIRVSKDRMSRAVETVPYRISNYVTLSAFSSRVDMKTTWNNTAEDHRLRVLFPLGARVEESHAESHFDVVKRDSAVTETADGWPEIYMHQKPQQGYLSMCTEGKGLTIANKGLTEFEMLGDSQGTAAVTLLRSVGWLSREDTLVRVGGAGAPTPVEDAQCLGHNEAEYSIIVHEGDYLSARSYLRAHEFMTPLYGSLTGKHEGRLPQVGGMIEVNGDHTLLLSACKKAEQSDALILRFWNTSKSQTAASVKLHGKPKQARYVDLKEEPMDRDPLEMKQDGSFVVKAEGAEIITLEITF
jgi:mannosylglycerate hydrolase